MCSNGLNPKGLSLGISYESCLDLRAIVDALFISTNVKINGRMKLEQRNKEQTGKQKEKKIGWKILRSYFVENSRSII